MSAKHREVYIEASWKAALASEFEQTYLDEVKAFIQAQRALGKTVFPPATQVFRAFDLSPFDKTKLLILGQDPYHGPGQAHGLCFSVQAGVRPPPSLRNIYKEIHADLGLQLPSDFGDLSQWAKQGVLLLNAMLTVNASEPASHRKAGWERFTDAAISALSEKRDGIVFLLWGRFAQDKSVLINASRHLVLKAPHPSPFSAHSGFFGCKHFSKANAYLKEQGKDAIDWNLDPRGDTP